MAKLTKAGRGLLEEIAAGAQMVRSRGPGFTTFYIRRANGMVSIAHVAAVSSLIRNDWLRDSGTIGDRGRFFSDTEFRITEAGRAALSSEEPPRG